MKIYFLSTFLFLGLTTFAQNQNNNWFFGNQAALTFSNGVSQALTTGEMIAEEGCASVSDHNTGNLLFYSNGVKIWDSNNNVMPNGDGLFGGISATQGVLILPYPGHSNLFYIFTLDEMQSILNGGVSKGFRYSVIDMSLNNGLGDVLPNQKNILIQENTTERMAVIENGDRTGYWIVIHEVFNNRFKAFSISSSGISDSAVISDIGSVHVSSDSTDMIGNMKFSPDGSKLALAIYGSKKIELFDFDKCSGKLGNVKTYSTPFNHYGIEFSPDNSKLYFSFGGIYQLDLSLPNPVPVLVDNDPSFNNVYSSALQLAPDNKIYVSKYGLQTLSVINQPNNSGVACNVDNQSVLLSAPSSTLLGLPPKVLDRVKMVEIEVNNLCLNDSTNFGLIGNSNINDVLWDFGVNELSDDTTTTLSPFFVYPSEGIYTVNAILACSKDTISIDLQILNCNSSYISNECQVKIPNVFTPNSDGLNDSLKPEINCNVKTFEFNILNRWGEIVWNSNSINSSWDGNHNGTECSDGVYFYILKYISVEGEKKNFNGTISLLR